MIVAVAAFSGMDALLKILSGSYPPMQVAVLRGMASLPFLLAPIALSGRWQLLRPRRLPMHVLRGALQVLVLGCFIYAVRVLSLANVYAVFLSAPLIMTALSVPILKERTDARGWLVDRRRAHRRPHHGAAERLGVRVARLARGTDRGPRLRRERHHGAGADPHRLHRERRGVDHQPDDGVRRSCWRCRTG